MTPGSFTYNNSYDTVYAPDSMVFNVSDTGIFTISSMIIDGCDTNFIDTIRYQRLGVQINYNINNPGTADVYIDGVLQNMPYSQNYWAGELINVSATIQPNWLFEKWQSYSNNILPNNNTLNASFVANSSDSCVLYTKVKPPLQAFISGNDSICSNSRFPAEVTVSLSGGVEPYTFVYAIDGVDQPPITTTVTPYIIETYNPATYTLTSLVDAVESGFISGSAMVTIKDAPIAQFISKDTINILYPSISLIDNSIGNIISWIWNFGDNSQNQFVTDPYHTYEDSIGIYQINLIVSDDLGCSDTMSKQIWITDEYWMYIPNAFTPDYDGYNDVFCIEYNGVRTETFKLNIYDRFSNLVYATNQIEDLECLLNSNGWNGTHFKTGEDLPMGTYIYEIYFQDFEGWKHSDQGTLHIIR